MARARNIKPSIMENEHLAALDPVARLLFIYLWMLADREGRLEDRPKRIAVRALPYDRDVDVDNLLDKLQQAGFITRYTVGDLKLIQVVNFSKHQTPHIREVASDLPGQCVGGVEEVQSTNLGSAKHRSSPSDSPFPLTDSPFPLTDSAGASPASGGKPARNAYPPEFEEAWSLYPRTKDVSKRDALKAWAARVKAGIDPGALIAGVKRYADYCVATKAEQQFIKHPSTFFGPGEHYAADWVPPKAERKTAHEQRADFYAEATGRNRQDGRIVEGTAARVD